MKKILLAILFSFAITTSVTATTAGTRWSGWPDRIDCVGDEPGYTFELPLFPQMYDTDGDFYSFADAYIYGGIGMWTAFDSGGNWIGSYGVEAECMQDLASIDTTQVRYYATAGQAQTMTIADDPTRNIFYGLIIFLTMFYGLIFYFRKQG